MNLRITSSPWGFRLTPLRKQLEILKQLGLSHFCGQFADFPGTFSDTMSDADVKGVLDTLDEFGMKVASWNAGDDFMAHSGIEDQIRLCCRQIDLASKFSPEIIIVFTGWTDRSDEAVYGQVTSALKQATRHAARYGLTVALENHGGLTRTAKQVNRIIQAVDEPNIGLNYDPANFEMYGEDALEAMSILEVPIVFTHLKSLRTDDKGEKKYCRLRDGMIDYLPILKKLRETYDGFYTLEYEEPADILEGTTDDLQSLKSLLDRIDS